MGKDPTISDAWPQCPHAPLPDSKAVCANKVDPPKSTYQSDRSNYQPEVASGRTEKKLVTGKNGFVVTAHPIATRVGAEILKMGGTAADAAVAIQLALTLVEPQSSGLGGGAFALYWTGDTRRLTSYDGRETAPKGATSGMFLCPNGREIPFDNGKLGGMASGVPGTPRLLETLHQKHGRLKWQQLFERVILLAEKGFSMSPRLAKVLASESMLINDSEARAYFYKNDCFPKTAGTTLKNPKLAATLRVLQAKGMSAFYEGRIADDIIKAMKREPWPSTMTPEDLKDYQVIERASICADYREFKVCGMGPPSSGAVTPLQILGILQYFDLQESGAHTIESMHLFMQAMRLAFADRNRYIADPNIESQPVEGLLDPAYLEKRAHLIDRTKDMEDPSPGVPNGAPFGLADDQSPELPSTSHFMVVDKWGNAISMTTTIEDQFGSRRMVDGFMLNNEMTDFTLTPTKNGKSVANRVEAQRRPRSSMGPTMVFGKDGNLTMLVGSPGGSQIIGYVAQTLISLIDWKLDPQTAVNAGHYGNRNIGAEVENGTEAAGKGANMAIQKKYASIVISNMTSGLSAAIYNPKIKVWEVGSDPRREVNAIGF